MRCEPRPRAPTAPVSFSARHQSDHVAPVSHSPARCQYCCCGQGKRRTHDVNDDGGWLSADLRVALRTRKRYHLIRTSHELQAFDAVSRHLRHGLDKRRMVGAQVDEGMCDLGFDQRLNQDMSCWAVSIDSERFPWHSTCREDHLARLSDVKNGQGCPAHVSLTSRTAAQGCSRERHTPRAPARQEQENTCVGLRVDGVNWAALRASLFPVLGASRLIVGLT